MSGIFYFAFGGLGDEGGFDLAVTKVVVVNQDQPVAQAGDFSDGQKLAAFLKSDYLKSILDVTEAADAAAARDAVDRQEAGVAVIIPAGLTAAGENPGERAAVELYQDPTLTLGPGIVKGIVSGIGGWLCRQQGRARGSLRAVDPARAGCRRSHDHGAGDCRTIRQMGRGAGPETTRGNQLPDRDSPSRRGQERGPGLQRRQHDHGRDAGLLRLFHRSGFGPEPPPQRRRKGRWPGCSPHPPQRRPS